MGGERRCPACEKEVLFKDMTPLTVKRNKKPPVTLYICNECYHTTANVLKIIKPHYPEQLVFEYLKK